MLWYIHLSKKELVQNFIVFMAAIILLQSIPQVVSYRKLQEIVKHRNLCTSNSGFITFAITILGLWLCVAIALHRYASNLTQTSNGLWEDAQNLESQVFMSFFYIFLKSFTPLSYKMSK